MPLECRRRTSRKTFPLVSRGDVAIACCFRKGETLSGIPQLGVGSESHARGETPSFAPGSDTAQGYRFQLEFAILWRTEFPGES